MFADSFCTSSSLDRTRRGWTTLVSFALQAFGLSVLLILPILYTEGLPQVRLGDLILAPPPASAPALTSRHPSESHLAATTLIVDRIMPSSHLSLGRDVRNDAELAPPIPIVGLEIGVNQGPRATELNALARSFSPVAPPAPSPLVTKPRLISRWMEGNLIRRVQPVYPALAISSRTQGTVQLRAVIGRDGKIRHLQVLDGHPLLVKAAVDAVSQWLYSPYHLNGQAVEVETQVTVNFVLGR